MIWQVKAVLLAAHCNKMCFFWLPLLTNFLSGLACKVWKKMQLHHLLMGVCNHELQLVFCFSSQRSLHNAPIFRLLLKVAVKGMHQCDFTNFWGTFGFQHLQLESEVRQSNSNVCMSVNKMCYHLGSLSLCYKLDNMDLSRIRHVIILAEGTRVLPVMCSAWWSRSPIDNSIHY